MILFFCKLQTIGPKIRFPLSITEVNDHEEEEEEEEEDDDEEEGKKKKITTTHLFWERNGKKWTATKGLMGGFELIRKSKRGGS
jgi:hypothetical protein